MPKTNPEDIISCVNSLSLLENTVSLMYRAIAEKTVETTAKSYLLKISRDSLEHSKLLKGFANWIIIPEHTSEPSLRKTTKVMQQATKLSEEIQALVRITGLEFSQMFEKLLGLENCLSEEYQSLMQLNSSQTLGNMFSGMSSDEEQHRQLLATAKALICQNKAEGTDNTPFVKYQNPDSWNKPFPSVTYDQS